MGRNPALGSSTRLNNRYRVTNKTRLRVVKGNIDADPLILDEDEEKARVISTAGVDAEDANEHHLQAVLSAAARRHQERALRESQASGDKAREEASAAYIPVPDSTGIVDDYLELYPPGRWRDPHNHIRSSDSVDEAVDFAIANGFTYYMDERDKDWLDKNNEEARGEGTSAQGSVSSSGTTTRSGFSQRSTRAKGKEADLTHVMEISEDLFELVMGIFEKVTHDKTEFLHHSLETGMTFPPFSDYEDTFANPLSPSMFAAFLVPQWIPDPDRLVRVARIIYPYWKERRLDRHGHRIIPTLNLDESDVRNESYICFRHRDVKAVRKTRTSQVSYSDKLKRLRSELAQSMELAQSVGAREKFKRETHKRGQAVWEKRLAFVELKTRFPSLALKEDDELLFDRERAPKKPRLDPAARLPPLRLRNRDSVDISSPVTRTEAIMKPKDRTANIQQQIEAELKQQRERDLWWEDQVDNAYQQQPLSYGARVWKYVDPSGPPRDTYVGDDGQVKPVHRAARLRRGRGGRLLIDRSSYPRPPIKPESLMQVDSDDEPEKVAEDKERVWRIMDRWKYDVDDVPPSGPDGLDEVDRELVDEYDTKYLKHTMNLLNDQDLRSLLTDHTIRYTLPDGRPKEYVPYRLGVHNVSRDIQQQHRAHMLPPHISAMHQHSGGTAVSVPTSVPFKMMQPHGIAQMRISSGGGMRPPSQLSISTGPPMAPPQPAPPRPDSSGMNGVINGVLGGTSNVNNGAEVDPSRSVLSYPMKSQPDGLPVASSSATSPHPSGGSSPVRPNSQNQHHANVPNGFHIPPNGTFLTVPNATSYNPHANGGHNGLSPQQVQNLKSAFSSHQPGQDPANGGANMQNRPSPYVLPGTNFNLPLNAPQMNLKLPPQRQVQWPPTHVARQPSGNGVDSSAMMNLSVSPQPHAALAVPGVPQRVPSATGMRGAVGMMQGRPPSTSGHGYGSPSVQHLQAHQLSPHHHGGNPASPQIQMNQPRPTQSPSMQQQHVQQVVGGNVNGF